MDNLGREEIPWLLYDSKTLGASDVTATLFQSPRGQDSKTFYDTNMDLAGQLQQPSEYDIFSIRAAVLPDLAITSAVALSKGSLRLTVGNKQYYSCPLSILSAGCGLAMQSDTAGAGTVSYGQFGSADPRNIHTLKVPIHVGIGEHFSVTLDWGTAPGAVKIYILFDGMLSRAVQ